MNLLLFCVDESCFHLCVFGLFLFACLRLVSFVANFFVCKGVLEICCFETPRKTIARLSTFQKKKTVPCDGALEV